MTSKFDGRPAASLQLLDCATRHRQHEWDRACHNSLAKSTESLKQRHYRRILCNLGYLEAVCVSSNDIKSVDSIMAIYSPAQI